MKIYSCDCDVCKQNHNFERILKKYPFNKKDKEFLEDLMVELRNVSLSNDVNEAILDGSWPSSKKWLGRSLEKAGKRRKK